MIIPLTVFVFELERNHKMCSFTHEPITPWILRR